MAFTFVQNQISPSTGTAATTKSVTITAGGTGNLIYGTILLGNTAFSSITQGSGFTVRNDGGAGPNLACADESQVQTSAGVTAVTFTTGGTDSSCIAIMTFLAATGGAAQVPYQPY